MARRRTSLKPKLRCALVLGVRRSRSRVSKKDILSPLPLPVAIGLTTCRVLSPVFATNPGFLCGDTYSTFEHHGGFPPPSSPFRDDISRGCLVRVMTSCASVELRVYSDFQMASYEVLSLLWPDNQSGRRLSAPCHYRASAVVSHPPLDSHRLSAVTRKKCRHKGHTQ